MRLAVLLTALAAVASAGASPPTFDALAISTICSSESASSGGGATRDMPPKLLPGFGNARFAVTTRSAEAQQWFTYGVRLAQAFAHEPAKAAFKEAARLDPDCAMCVWGQAWAEGPTINYPVGKADRAAALVLAVKARDMAATKGGTQRERDLTLAMVKRYEGGSGDKAFAKAMKALVATYPADNEIAVIAADAMMVAGDDKQAEPLLAAVLTRDPQHTGAIHFYIHATERNGRPERALPYADRLASLAPGASHLIHMPSHTFFSVGRYRSAAAANLDAMEVDKAWMKTVGWTKSDFEIPYYGHNIRFALAGAMMSGDSKVSLRIADHYSEAAANLASAGKSPPPYAQFGTASAWMAYGRFTDPDVVLARPEPQGPIVRAFWRYARGEALARKGDAAGVRAEAAKVALTPDEMKTLGKGRIKPMLDIAHQVLLGRAAMIEGRYAEASKAFRKAADHQDRMLGDSRDPPPWWYPVRRSLAAALLAEGRYSPALEQARLSLKTWPNDPLALLVLARAQEKLGLGSDARESLKQAEVEWLGEPLAGFPANGV